MARCPSSPSLPLAAARGVSIDDATTTEIDDAFSVRPLANGHFEIGIHIAAPALAIARGSTLDAIARARLSTVYMPGRKITMLPDAVLDAFTLAAGAARPALSLYVEAAPDGTPIRHADAPRPRSRRGKSSARRHRRALCGAGRGGRTGMDRRTAHAVASRAKARSRARQARSRRAANTTSGSIGRRRRMAA